MHKCRHRIPFAINMAHSWTFWPCQDEKQPLSLLSLSLPPLAASVALIALFDQWQNATGKSCTNFIFRTPNCDHQCRLRDLTATSYRGGFAQTHEGLSLLRIQHGILPISPLLLLAALTAHLPALKLNFNSALHKCKISSQIKSKQNFNMCVHARACIWP